MPITSTFFTGSAAAAGHAIAKTATPIAIRDNQTTTRQRQDEIMWGTSSESRAKSRRFMSRTARILQEICPQIAATFPAFRAPIGSLNALPLGYNTRTRPHGAHHLFRSPPP
jgi:hypothetical protein